MGTPGVERAQLQEGSLGLAWAVWQEQRQLGQGPAPGECAVSMTDHRVGLAEERGAAGAQHGRWEAPSLGPTSGMPVRFSVPTSSWSPGCHRHTRTGTGRRVPGGI